MAAVLAGPGVSGPIACRSLLVLGGARSGKSAFAQAVAEGSGLDLLFVATAQALDADMTTRISRHAAARPPRWALVEEPLALDRVIAREGAPGRFLLVDCATLWLSNQMGAGADLQAESRALAAAVAAARGPIAVVSNEVGQGVVPATSAGRTFRDAQGRLNAELAAVCTSVVAVEAGLPRCLKPAPTLGFTFG